MPEFLSFVLKLEEEVDLKTEEKNYDENVAKNKTTFDVKTVIYIYIFKFCFSFAGTFKHNGPKMAVLFTCKILLLSSYYH